MRHQSDGDGRRLDIQGLRCIAAMSVVLFHASTVFPSGFLGVDIFFVISGFIIAEIVAREISTTGRFAIGRFLERRLRRLMPPMIIVVIATIGLSVLVDTPSRLAASLPLAGAAALAGGINHYFLWGAVDYFQTFRSNPLLHLWSLSVELQFYVLLGLAVSLGMSISRLAPIRGAPSNRSGYRCGCPKRRDVTMAVVLLSITSLAATLTIGRWHASAGIALPAQFAFFVLPSRLWEFGLGILAHLFHVSIHRRLAGSAIDLLQGASLLALGASLTVAQPHGLLPGQQAIAPCVAAAALIATGPGGMIGRLLSWPGLTYLGDRSYSIYLWQGPLIVYASTLFASAFATALSAAISIAVSVLTFRGVEQAFRGADRITPARRGAQQLLILYGAAVTACVAAAVIVPTALAPHWAPAPVRATALDTKCERQRGIAGLSPCVYGPPGARKLLLIWDSHAAAISQAVIDAAARSGWQAHVATASACAVPEHPENLDYRPSCAGYAANALSYARQQQFDLVILQQFSDFYVTELEIGAARWKQGLGRFIEILAGDGAQVILVGDSPRLPMAVGRPVWARSWRVDLASSLDQRRTLDAIEAAAAAAVPGGRYLSAAEHMCNTSGCPVFEDGAWVYTDADHLSHQGADRLAATIEREILLTPARP